MDKEKIKKELIKSVSAIPKTPTNLKGIRGFANHWGTRAEEFEPYTEKVTQTLNEILKEGNIDLDGEPKKDLLAYLKPTMTKLIGDFLKN